MKNPMSSQSSAIICDHPDNFLGLVKLHKLAGLRAFLIQVINDDTGNAPHHIQKFESEVWISFKSSLEIISQRLLSLLRPPTGHS